MTRESDSFIVRGKLVADWEKQMWDVIQFVVYPQFLSLQRTRKDATEVRYEMVSASHSGLAFRIEFIFTNSG